MTKRFVLSYLRSLINLALKLVLKINTSPTSSTKTWKDNSKQKVEDILGSFFDFIYSEATKSRNIQLEKERIKQEEEKAEQLRLQKQKEKEDKISRFNSLKTNEAKKLKRLPKASSLWEESCKIRKYIEDSRQKAEKYDKVTPEFEEWVKESLAFANRLDPTVQTPPSILDLDLSEDDFNKSWEEIEVMINQYMSK